MNKWGINYIAGGENRLNRIRPVGVWGSPDMESVNVTGLPLLPDCEKSMTHRIHDTRSMTSNMWGQDRQGRGFYMRCSQPNYVRATTVSKTFTAVRQFDYTQILFLFPTQVVDCHYGLFFS